MRRALGYFISIMRVPMGIDDRLICLGILGKWSTMRLRSLANRNLSGLVRLEPAAEPVLAARQDGVPSLSIK